MENLLLANENEYNRWVVQRKRWNEDFNPKPPVAFPVIVFWDESEYRGYAYTSYKFIDLEFAQQMVITLKS